MHIGSPYHHLTVEAAGTQKGRIEDFRAIGSSEENNALTGVETIHFRQELVEGLLALIVMLHGTYPARLSHHIQLIDKDDRWRLRLRLLKEIAHSCGAHPSKHLYKIRATQAEKRHMGLARHGPGQERFARAWRTNQQHALGNPTAQSHVSLWLPQEIDNLLEFFLCLLSICHISKGDARGTCCVHSCPALTELHHALSKAHATNQKDPENATHTEWEKPLEQGGDNRLLVLPTVLHPAGFQIAEQMGVLDPHGDKALRPGRRVCSTRG